MSLIMGERATLPFIFNQTDLLAGTSQELIAPCDGFVNELHTTVQAAPTTGGAIGVGLGDTPTAVAGLSITVADAAVKGTRQSAVATPGDATRVVKKGDRIQVTAAAAFATAGALNGYVEIVTGY